MEIKITKLPGDGIGPEVINEAVKVCEAISKKFNHNSNNWTNFTFLLRLTIMEI